MPYSTEATNRDWASIALNMGWFGGALTLIYIGSRLAIFPFDFTMPAMGLMLIPVIAMMGGANGDDFLASLLNRSAVNAFLVMVGLMPMALLADDRTIELIHLIFGSNARVTPFELPIMGALVTFFATFTWSRFFGSR